jgi:hypothetical protein
MSGTMAARTSDSWFGIEYLADQGPEAAQTFGD